MRRQCGLILAGCLVVGLGSAGCASAPVHPVAASRAAPAEESREVTVLVTERGDVYVWDPGVSQEPVHRRVPGDAYVHAAVPAPSGRGLLLLVERWHGPEESDSRLSQNPVLGWLQVIQEVARRGDLSSDLLWMDPRTGATRTVFDSYRDRWSGEGVIAAARRRAGVHDVGVPDNDWVDLFRDPDGAVHAVAEDGSTYRLRLEGDHLAGMELVSMPKERGQAPDRQTIAGREGTVMRWKPAAATAGAGETQ